MPCCSNPVVKSNKMAVGKKDYADATGTINDPPVLRMMANWGKRRNPGTPSTPTGVTAVVSTAHNLFKQPMGCCDMSLAHESSAHRMSTSLAMHQLGTVPESPV